MLKYKLMVALFLMMIVAGSGFAVSTVVAWIPTVLIIGGICGIIYTIVHAAMDD